MMASTSLRRLAQRTVAITLVLLPKIASAQQALGGTGEVQGLQGDVRSVVRTMLIKVVSYTALAAVVVIVIAGIILVVAGSDDTRRDMAKKAIIYSIVGILVIGVASAFVLFVTTLF